MARASTPTSLSLDGFARVLGISPVHFQGADGSTVFPIAGACRDVWPQYNWQTDEDMVSREELAQAIHDAERDIRSVLGYDVAPVWHEQEVHMWPRTVRGHWNPYPIVKTNWDKIIASGRRAVSAIQAGAAVVYSDPDGDGWSERATITVNTTVTVEGEVKVYFAGESGDPAWEIRPLRSVSISGGVATITADAWLFIDPDLWEAYPTTSTFAPIDVSTTANYVATVDVYREYTDSTQPSAVFYWAKRREGANGLSPFFCANCGGTGCVVCGLTSANGCFSVVDSELGTVQPYTGTYDAEDEVWNYTAVDECRLPDQVKLYYLAGNLSERYLRGQTLDPLDPHLAQAITWLAIARLARPICDCSNVLNTVRELRLNAAAYRQSERGDFVAHFNNEEIFTNPFGTRVGEIKAWQRISNLTRENSLVGGVL